MDRLNASKQRPGFSPAQAAVAGAAVGAGLCLLLWATAAAQVVPPSYPAWIRDFGPRQGLERLSTGLFIFMLTGALLFGLMAFAWSALRPRR